MSALHGDRRSVLAQRLGICLRAENGYGSRLGLVVYLILRLAHTSAGAESPRSSRELVVRTPTRCQKQVTKSAGTEKHTPKS